VKLNGMEVSGGHLQRRARRAVGVPIALVSGDRLAVTQVQHVAPRLKARS